MRANAAQHGTRSKANAGCTCDDCRAANATYAREWRARRLATGEWRLVHGRWLPARKETAA